MSGVILTSPHAKCNIYDGKRHCDTVAGVSADVLGGTLLNAGVACVKITGNEYRVDYDLNRTAGRVTSFRKRLSAILSAAGSSRTLLMDIHSFPNYWMEEAGDINFFKRGETAPDIVLLKGPRDVFRGKFLCDFFISKLKENFNCKIIEGIKVNDIMNEASEYDVGGILLEFNEKYKDDLAGLNCLCGAIGEVVKELME